MYHKSFSNYDIKLNFRTDYNQKRQFSNRKLPFLITF